MRRLERAGEFLGEQVGKRVLNFLEKRAEGFNVKISGLENLKSLQDKSYIIAANHIKPATGTERRLPLPADALVIANVIREETGQEIKIISKSDDGWWAENPLHRRFQKEMQPLGDSLVAGTGHIPVRANPGSSKRNFVSNLAAAIESNYPILVFVEGEWFDDFAPEHKIEPGAAHIARKYDLPIIPTYIFGCRSLQKPVEEDVYLSFGSPISAVKETPEMTQLKNKEEINEEIREGIAQLQQQVAVNCTQY